MATAETTAEPVAVTAPRPLAADYFELTKPKIGVMALVTVATGYLLGAAPDFRADVLLHTLIGAGAVAAGGSALNHWLERRADAKMSRTSNRPIPAGRVPAADVFAFGLTLAVGGVAYLWYALATPAAAVVAGLTAFLYVAVYTPLKQVTAWNTVIGAVPGALPPVIGWCAARGGAVTAEAAALFVLLFVWQLPHFYAIAWLHRADYARGGMRMLPVVDRPDGRLTGLATELTAVLLVAATAGPFLAGAAGWVYLIGAVPLGVWFLVRTVRFGLDRNDRTARSVLRGSLVYLVGVMGLLVLNGVLPRYVG